MKVIVPCCGRSSRFPNLPPKWTLPGHDGLPMICAAVRDLQFDPADLIVTLLREHEERFAATAGLAAAFGRPVRTCILEQPTRSQGETIAETLQALQLDEPFLVKDADGAFDLADLAATENYVCIDTLNNHDLINPRSKSYVQLDGQGRIIAIREKVVISDTFNVGGYYFTSPQQFLEYYHRAAAANEATRETFVSDVIGQMLTDGIPFRGRSVARYRDWGTLHEWRRALMKRKNYFVLLDGFLFERGSRYFRPGFEEVQPNERAVEAVRNLAAAGHHITYLSIRPPSLAELTNRQLATAGAPPGHVTYDCSVAPWTLVTAPHGTLPFCTSEALELSPDDVHLLESIRGSLRDGT